MSAEAAPRTARRRVRTRWAIAVVAVLAVAVAVAAAWPLLFRQQSSASDQQTETVKRETLVVTVSGDGEAAASDTWEVYPEVNGTVEKVFVEEGEYVKKGDTLFTISNSDLSTAETQARASYLKAKGQVASSEQQYDQAQESVEKAELQLMQAEAELEKLEDNPKATDSEIEIAEKNVATAKKGVTTAEAGVDVADSGMQTAEADLASSRDSYNDAIADSEATTVEAPGSGVVTSLSITKGSSVSAGSSSQASSSGDSGSSSSGATAASTASDSSSGSSSGSAPVVISRTSKMVARIQVNEADLPKIKVGQKADVTFDSLGSKATSATIIWISPTGTNSNDVVTYDVDVRLAKRPSHLKIGMTATAEIVTKKIDDAITVPSSAIRVNGSQKYVLVVAADGQTRQAPIKVGDSSDTRTVVTKGLEEGDVIVSSSGSAGSTDSGDTQGGPPGGGMGMIAGPGGRR
ncbi:MAG: efflux RND transporter periplasmic adaptor subunit [Coriobacteriales bacterium]|nr:efflux RND transporter periplasmic adaptor subunit [Coriobacteriales bacterium]